MEICQKFKKKQKLYALGIALILLAAGSLLSKRSKPSGENTLQPLLVREMYASGSILERSKTFAARFESYMETAVIPNIREDSTGQDTAIITDSKSYRLSAVGAEPGERIIPTGYFCGNFLSFSLQGEQLFVHFKPTLYTDASNAAIYLDDFQDVTAQIVFQYDDSGKIDGFEIGEAIIK